MENGFAHRGLSTLERRCEAVISVIRIVGVTLFLILFSTASNAAVGCREHISGIVLHSLYGVFFTTDKTCTQGWCSLGWADTNAVNRGYAMLLAAKSQGKNIVFYWANLSSCSASNSLYASPDYFYFDED